MDAATRGQTIRRARRRRGLPQAVLAGLVDRSESWLSQVERGVRDVDSHRVLTRLAEVLRLEISDLTGTDSPEKATHRYTAAHQIERAMMRHTPLGPLLEEHGEALVDVEHLRLRADQAHAAYQATHYDDVGRRLPRLIRDVETAARGRDADRPLVCSVRAQVYNTVAAVLRRVGERELAWTAAEPAGGKALREDGHPSTTRADARAAGPPGRNRAGPSKPLQHPRRLGQAEDRGPSRLLRPRGAATLTAAVVSEALLSSRSAALLRS